MFSVNETEKDETSFFAPTTPYRPQNVSPTPKKYNPYDPKKLIKGGMLKNVGRNTTLVEKLMTLKEGYYIPSQLIGMEIKTSFNGIWGTEAKWHKLFYKDIKAYVMFTGTFEAEKTISSMRISCPTKFMHSVRGSNAMEIQQLFSFSIDYVDMILYIISNFNLIEFPVSPTKFFSQYWSYIN